jgi:hypothetical protein
MDKIVEEVLTNLIKRVEALEGLVPTKKAEVGTKYPEKKGMVTEGQLNFIRGLGGEVWPDMTSKEASEYIDKLKAKKSVPEKQVQNDSVPERRLTQAEIDALPEEAFL